MVTWFGAGLDLRLGRAWYLMVSGTRESGPDATAQLYTALSYRFQLEFRARAFPTAMYLP